MLKKLLTVSALSLAVTLLTVVADQANPTLQWVSSAIAQEQGKNDQPTRRTPALRNAVYEKLAEAQAAAEAKDYAGAAELLDAMIDKEGKSALNSYELANVYNLYAFLAYSKEDFNGALRYYREVIAQPEIPLAMEINTRFTVAQLHFVQEQWQQGIDALLQWFALTDKPNATAYVLLSQGYYQLKDYDRALANVEIAIKMHEDEGKLPKEQWYNLARFLYFDKGDFDKALDILEILLVYYPNKQYWVQASHLYGEKQDSVRQLAMMETAYMQGMLDRSTDLVTMAYLYLNAESPYAAGRVMEQGFDDEIIEEKSKNYEIAGNAWRSAREVARAIPMMEIAAEKAEDGELFARLANVYLDGDQFENAAASARRALAKGGVNRPDQTRLVLGMAYFNMGDYTNARKTFREAARDDRSKTYAQQWLRYITSEEERLRQLAEG